MESYFENVIMPDDKLRIDSFYSSSFRHVVEVHPHWHPEIEILYISDGCATQQVNGSYFLAEEGDIIIINKDQLHSTYSYQGHSCDILVLMFDSSSMLDNVYGNSILSNGFIFRNPIKVSESDGEMIYDCMLGIHQELSRRDSAFEYMVKSQLYKLVGILTKSSRYNVIHTTQNNNQMAKNMLENTFRLIDESYNTDISLKKAAEASNLSTPHFCRLFKKTTGMTFMDYLSFYRVNRAEKLLSTHMTIAQVAFECGFGSLSSFIRNYKKFKKCTPSSYKNIFFR